MLLRLPVTLVVLSPLFGCEVIADALPRDSATKREDNSFRVLEYNKAIDLPSHRMRVGPRMSGSSTYTIAQKLSMVVGANVNGQADQEFLDIISKTIGVDLSKSHDVTLSMSNYPGYYNLNCRPEQVGELYWYPTFDQWVGLAEPSKKEISITIPNTVTNGDIRAECSD